MDTREKVFHNKVYEKIFKTHVYQLKQNIVDCNSVLDLGCGPNSPLQYCNKTLQSVGVEVYEPYLKESKNKKIHTRYIQEDINKVEFQEDEFDAVVLFEVLEHMKKEEGLDILRKAGKWASKKIIISTPNGFLNQDSVDGNDYQKHLSGWNAEELEHLGFELKGFEGLRSLRKYSKKDNTYYLKLKYKPEVIWVPITILSQLIAYSRPSKATELFGCKYLW